MKPIVRSALTAVLGPTNTGKTHLAVERMLAHSSGMMGFPLRLLAREVYDRVVAARGVESVALVTGEERIWPATARYLLCTAEAMPLAATAADGGAADGPRDVAFVALDEAQLGQDRERGHVFTSRLLHARGREETMILGSGSLAPVVRSLLPDAEITARPRFSTLSYDGPRKLSRLPPRSAIVAFSAEEVYAIAEALRRFSGGAAVVMGALSPATRNAQVAMFQAGEVDYLVATDAIGMGLNLDVAHVAFASLNKFDGVRQRRLTTAEMAQIAGRAGRHQRDGTFGSVGSETAFTDEEIRAIEEHHFAPIDWLHWRNPTPDTSSLASLIAGLEAPPPHPALRPAPEATDLQVLRRLSEDADALSLIDDGGAVRRLWSACSLPDFRKSGIEAHGRLVARIWKDLATGNGHIDADWFMGQLRPLDNAEGGVEQLADRIAAVRTYCYIAHRPDWLGDPAAMAEQARTIEARLSDALHNALTARFVDRRTTVLLRALGQGASTLPVKVGEEGIVRVDGEAIGQLDGFTFRVDPATRAADQRMLLAAAERHLAVELASRATALASAPDAHLALDISDGAPPSIRWHGLAVATLAKGRHRLAPRIQLDKPVAALDSHVVAAVQARLQGFVDDAVGQHLRPLVAMAARARATDASPDLRAVLAALVDAGGNVVRETLDTSIAAMPPEAREELRRFGIRVGTLDLFHPALIKPAPLNWLAALDAAWRGVPAKTPPSPGIALVAAAGDEPPASSGFRRVGDWWLRVDLAERIAHHTHGARRASIEAMLAERKAKAKPPAAADPANAVDAVTESEAVAQDAAQDEQEKRPEGAFRVNPELARSIGLPLADRLAMLRLLGFRTLTPPKDVTAEEEPLLWWTWRGRQVQRDTARPRGKWTGNKGGDARRSPQRGAAQDMASRDAPSGDRTDRPHRDGDRSNARARNTGQQATGLSSAKPRQDRGQGQDQDRGQGQDRGKGRAAPGKGQSQGHNPSHQNPSHHNRPPSGPRTINENSPFAALAGLFGQSGDKGGDKSGGKGGKKGGGKT